MAGSKTNGHSNGHTNGHSNGHSNGHVDTHKTAGGALKLQYHVEKNISWFWVLAATACMIIVPLFIYWCWICVAFNQGHMLLPKAYTRADISEWWSVQVWARILQHALPTWYATKIYMIWLTFQAILFHFGPGPIGYGVPLDHLDGERLPYKYNGQFAWLVTLPLALGLHFTGIFPLTELVDHYAPLLSVCIIVTSAVIALLHIWAVCTTGVERPSNSILYDYFMGPLLNPRIGSFDVKFFFELRPGIMHWYFTTLGFAAKQYADEGTISTPMALICFYHLCFVNACYKGEQCVPHSIDIIYEKFGWMLCMLDIVMVPFIFPMQAFYLYKIGLYEHNTIFTVAVFLMHVIGYWIFDTANSQKDYFREKPEEEIAKGFPRLPWDKIQNPKYLKTERGSKLLLSGWWAYARHMNYLGDIMMSWAWGFTCGFGSYFPYAYTTYLTPLLLHRLYRDDAKCQAKYGKDWDKYCKMVPYRLIPYVY